jgi:hypothetical protein
MFQFFLVIKYIIFFLNKTNDQTYIKKSMTTIIYKQREYVFKATQMLTN